jgi:hypothetical protein
MSQNANKQQTVHIKMKLERTGRFTMEIASDLGQKIGLFDLFYIKDNQKTTGGTTVVDDPVEALGLEEIPFTCDEIIECLRSNGYHLATKFEASLVIEMIRENAEERVLVYNNEDKEEWFSIHLGKEIHRPEDKDDLEFILKFFEENRPEKRHEDYALICVKGIEDRGY